MCFCNKFKKEKSPSISNIPNNSNSPIERTIGQFNSGGSVTPYHRVNETKEDCAPAENALCNTDSQIDTACGQRYPAHTDAPCSRMNAAVWEDDPAINDIGDKLEGLTVLPDEPGELSLHEKEEDYPESVDKPPVFETHVNTSRLNKNFASFADHHHAYIGFRYTVYEHPYYVRKYVRLGFGGDSKQQPEQSAGFFEKNMVIYLLFFLCHIWYRRPFMYN